MKIKHDDLPSNRFELLKDRLKTRWLDFITVSLLCLTFLIPLLAWILSLNYSSAFSFTNDNYLVMSLIAYSPFIPLVMIFGLGISGAMYFSKRLAFGEGASVIKDFFYGIRVNLPRSLFAYFFLGLAFALLNAGKVIITFSRAFSAVAQGILIGLMYVAFILLFMIFAFFLSQSILYKGSKAQLFMNSIKFTFGMFGWNLLIFLVVLFPFFIYEFVPFLIAGYIAIIIASLFYFELSVFVFMIYSFAIYDLTLNLDYPEIYRKGLTEEIEKPTR